MLLSAPVDDRNRVPPPMKAEERRKAEALVDAADRVIAALTDEADKLARARDSYRRRLEGR